MQTARLQSAHKSEICTQYPHWLPYMEKGVLEDAGQMLTQHLAVAYRQPDQRLQSTPRVSRPSQAPMLLKAHQLPTLGPEAAEGPGVEGAAVRRVESENAMSEMMETPTAVRSVLLSSRRQSPDGRSRSRLPLCHHQFRPQPTSAESRIEGIPSLQFAKYVCEAPVRQAT